MKPWTSRARDNSRVPVRASLAAAAVSLGCYSVFLARQAPGFTFAGSTFVSAAALLGAAWLPALAGSGLGRSSDHRRAGVLVMLAGIGWLLGEWDNPESAPAVVFSLGLVLFAVAPAVLTHAVFTIGGPVTRTHRGLVASSYLITIGLIGLMPALWNDPAARGCTDRGSRNLWLIANAPTSHHHCRVGFPRCGRVGTPRRRHPGLGGWQDPREHGSGRLLRSRRLDACSCSQP